MKRLLFMIPALVVGCSSGKPPKPIPTAVAAAEQSVSQARKLSAAGNWQSAATQWGSALERYRLLNDRTNEAIALHNLGEARQESGDLGKARDLFEAAAALNSNLNKQDAWWRNQIALLQVEARSGRTNELAARIEKLDARKSSDKTVQGLFLNERGLWHSNSGNFQQAAADFEQAIDFFRGEKDEAGMAVVQANQALLLERQKKFPEAAEAWRAALKAFESQGNPTAIAVSMAGRGRSLLAADKDLPMAEDLLQRAAKNFRVLHADAQRRDVEALLKKALEAQGKKASEMKDLP